MKIALKNVQLVTVAMALSCLTGGVLGGASSAWAQINTAVQPTSPAATATPTPTAVSASVPAPASPEPAAETAAKIIPPPGDAAAMATTAAAVSDKDGKKSLSNVEDKVSDSVKSIAKRLSNTDNVTLDDLNSARQAVAKIEALIDIEKHLNELEKIRSEREGGGRSGMGSIPASALNPYGNAMPSLPMPAVSAMPISAIPGSAIQPLAFSGTDVTRIVGSNGRFSAILKTGDGQTKTVEVGDHVDGATVTSITTAGVELNRNGVKRVLHVKNVRTVFGNTP